MPGNHGHKTVEVPHLEDVVLFLHGLDDAPRPQEQQGLEEGVGQEVKHAADDIRGPHRQNHVAHLADGGVGQHPLHVGLGQGRQGGVKGGYGADRGNDIAGRREPAAR